MKVSPIKISCPDLSTVVNSNPQQSRAFAPSPPIRAARDSDDEENEGMVASRRNLTISDALNECTVLEKAGKLTPVLCYFVLSFAWIAFLSDFLVLSVNSW